MNISNWPHKTVQNTSNSIIFSTTKIPQMDWVLWISTTKAKIEEEEEEKQEKKYQQNRWFHKTRVESWLHG